MNRIDSNDAWRVAQACAWYMYNRREHEFLAFFFDGEKHEALATRKRDDPYVSEWAARWRTRNFAELFGAMDYMNQRRFVGEILRVYEEDTARALKTAEDFR